MLGQKKHSQHTYDAVFFDWWVSKRNIHKISYRAYLLNNMNKQEEIISELNSRIKEGKRALRRGW